MVRQTPAKSPAPKPSPRFFRLQSLWPLSIERGGRCLTTIAIVMAAACSRFEDAPTGPTVASGSPSIAINPTFPDGRPKNQDEMFAELATRIPGYAGTYFAADGTPVTNLVDLAKAGDVDKAIEAFVRDGYKGEGRRKSLFKKVGYDFVKLKQWKDSATQTLLTRRNVAYVDIDEANNRLSIGVLNAAESDNANRFLRDNKIPGMVALVVPVDTSPNYNNNPPSSAETLRNTRSLYGGVQIKPQAFNSCTLGFNAMMGVVNGNFHYLYSYDHFFVTAAHCMYQMGYASNTPIYQTPDQYGSTSVIGYEYRQPQWRPQSQMEDCPAGSLCSLAESALVRYVVPWGGPRIARTTWPGTYGSDTGSVTLDPYYAPWSVVDSVIDHTLLYGAVLHKVGWKTGWTQGSVSQTCVNARVVLNGYPTQWVGVCQWTASMGAGPGDSGGPVFKNKFGSYPNVQIVGNVTNGNSIATQFSFYPYIAYELLTRYDYSSQCLSGPCWTQLVVSNH